MPLFRFPRSYTSLSLNQTGLTVLLLFRVYRHLERLYTFCSLCGVMCHWLRATRKTCVFGPAASARRQLVMSTDKIYIYRHHSLADTPLPRHEFPSLNFAFERTFALQKGSGTTFFFYLLFFFSVPCSVFPPRGEEGVGRGEETRAVSPSPSLSRLKFLFPCNFVAVQGQAAAAGIVTVQVGVTVRWWWWW